MTIRKRRPWGAPGTLGESGVVIRRDGEAAAVLAEARAARRPLPDLGLVGGDLCATLGGLGSEAHLHGPDARRYPVDLGIAVADGVEYVFVAHVLVRRPWWRGRIVAVMNAQWHGSWDLGPRAHPNDGLLDISDARLGFADKIAALQRVRTGTHLPHPDIAVRRSASATLEFDPPGRVFVDGEPIGRVRHLQVRVEPDAFGVVI